MKKMNFLFDFTKIKSNKSNKMSEKLIDKLADWVFRLELDQEKMMIAVAKMQKKAVVIPLSLGSDTISLISYDKESYFPVATKYYQNSNNEINISPLVESVRKNDMSIIASRSNNLMTLCSLIRSCGEEFPMYITVLCIYKKAPIMESWFVIFSYDRILRLITVDLNVAQLQSYFAPVDNLYAINYLIDAIKLDHKVQDMILVSPEADNETLVAACSKKMNIPYTLFTKPHPDHSPISKYEMVYQVDLVGKTCLIVNDDIDDNLVTMNFCAQELKDKGAKLVIAAIGYGAFSGNAIDNLNNGTIDLMYVIDKLHRVDKTELSSKIKLVPMSDLIVNSIKSWKDTCRYYKRKD
jgi:phosphoribosylpyrophosphate synthetase